MDTQVEQTIGRRVRHIKTSRLLSSAIIGIGLLAIGGIAGAADSNVVYNGCENVATGVVRLLNNTNLTAPFNACLTADVIAARHLSTALTEVPISWNQQGPPGQNGAAGKAGGAGTNGSDGASGADGKNGISVTSAALSIGDPNCPNGGSAFTSASGTTYACNGAPGTAPGLTSPDGSYAITVTNAGIVLSGPSGTVTLGPLAITVYGTHVNVMSDVTTSIKGESVSINNGLITVSGEQVQLGNGTCASVARVGDRTFVPPPGGNGQIVTGSFGVLAC